MLAGFLTGCPVAVIGSVSQGFARYLLYSFSYARARVRL